MAKQRTFRVSRHRLTECPHCEKHIALAPAWRTTTCPFCQQALLSPKSPSQGLSRLARLGGSMTAAMAAGLLGLGLSGCGEGEPLEPLTPPADMGPAVPLYGLPPMDAGLADAGEPIPQPEYGLPPPDAGFFDGGQVDAGLADAGEPLPTPEYGLPPAMDGGMLDADLADAFEPTPEPDYGLPPILDGGTLDAASPDGEVNSPLYGLAPALDAGESEDVG